jgi:MFS family permease
VVEVSKRTVTRIFVASLIAIAGSLVLLFTAGGLAYANDVFVMDGPDVVGVRGSAFGWWMLGLAIVAAITLIGALIAQFVAWIGAVLNTSQLPDKTWFLVLLITGLLSFGFIPMIIYLIAGPADSQPLPPSVAPDVLPSAVPPARTPMG